MVHGGVTITDHNNDLLAYATSIIARLRMELDVERQNHSRTVEEANLRIEELEAKVAVREAELENCVTFPGYDDQQPEELPDVPTHAFEKQKLSKRLPKPKPLSDEECLRFLESNSARNRSLEIEIRQIAERVSILPYHEIIGLNLMRIVGASKVGRVDFQRYPKGTSITTAKWSESNPSTQSPSKKCIRRSKCFVAPIGRR